MDSTRGYVKEAHTEPSNRWTHLPACFCFYLPTLFPTYLPASSFFLSTQLGLFEDTLRRTAPHGHIFFFFLLNLTIEKEYLLPDEVKLCVCGGKVDYSSADMSA